MPEVPGPISFLGLQAALAEEIRSVLSGITTTDYRGNDVYGVTVYEQNLPIPDPDAEPDDIDGDYATLNGLEPYFPYALVRIYEAVEDEESDGGWDVTAEIHLGVHDADLANQGHRHILNMIQRIVDRFTHEPVLEPYWIAVPNRMAWAVQEDADSAGYPFYFGGVSIHFEAPKIDRRWPGGYGI